MRFVKVEGLGNDFVVFDGPFEPAAADVKLWCDRRRGIGADGVLTVAREDPYRVAMRYWNADGGEAEMCGNGLRCVARLAYERGWVHAREFVVGTAAGDRPVTVLEDGNVRALVGRPSRGRVATLEVRGVTVIPVRVGNPHAVLWVDDPDTAEVATLGPAIERAPIFPDGTNVEFVTVEDEHAVRMRIWERGVGETQASGTGAAAAAFAALSEELVTSPVVVTLPGGQLTIEFDDDGAWMTGPASIVFEGELPPGTGSA
jgi:diaminopimelate epimerase